MLKNYFKTAIRNLFRYKASSIINIVGLMVGFAAFLLILLVVQYEQSFDNFHAKKNAIYRVIRAGKHPTDRDYRTGVPVPVTQTLRNEFPQVTNAAAILADNGVQVNVLTPDGKVAKKFKENSGVFFAERQFFQIFDFGLEAGDIKTALVEPHSVLLTKETASKYYGDWKTAIGKTIRMDRTDLKVTGILKDIPVNTDFPIKAVLSYRLLKEYTDVTEWGSIMDQNYCFVQLNDHTTKAQFDKLLAGFTEKYIKPADSHYDLFLQPLNEIHYDARLGNYNGRTFSKDLILALNLIAFFLLVIACVNFINLTTAQASKRSREVGVRKVLGGDRRQLIFQFLGETGLTCLLALVGALVIVFVCLPFVNDLMEIQLTAASLYNWRSALVAVVSLIVVTCLSGFYPAMVLSGFQPAHVLKGAAGADKVKGVLFRRGLVLGQFVIAQVLIIGTLVVASQMDYFRNADLGFKKDAILNASIPDDSLSRTRVPLLYNQLSRIPGVHQVSLSASPPSAGGGWYTDLSLPGVKPYKREMVVSMKPADTSYFHLYDLKLVAGRIYFASDTVREYVVNETVIRQLGIRNPQDALGKMINVSGKIYPIVGVVKDYHDNSLRDPINAVVMIPGREMYRTASLQIDLRKAKSIIASMEKEWNSEFPDYMFEYAFLDDAIAHYYTQENQLSKLYTIFSAIAILISCLGLYGLISFMAVQRRKEIGIRKVLGAPVRDIVVMLSKEFTLLILFAFLISAPVAWYFMHQWLEQYSYRIDFGVGFFAVTIVGSLAIAWLTVGYTAIKAAMANPVESIKTE